MPQCDTVDLQLGSAYIVSEKVDSDEQRKAHFSDGRMPIVKLILPRPGGGSLKSNQEMQAGRAMTAATIVAARPISEIWCLGVTF